MQINTQYLFYTGIIYDLRKEIKSDSLTGNYWFCQQYKSMPNNKIMLSKRLNKDTSQT